MTIRLRTVSALIAVALAAAGLAFAASNPATAAPSSNDDFANAIALTEGVEADFDLTDATVETGLSEFPCDGSATLWYSFTAPADGSYVAYTADSNFDVFVGMFTAIDTTLGCDDDSLGSGSLDGVTVAQTMTTGQTLYIQISHFDAGLSGIRGSGRVGVTRVEAAVDNFSSAPALGFATGADTAVRAVNAGVSLATSETGEPIACGTGTMGSTSTWLDFTPTSSRTWMASVLSDLGSDIAVYAGSAVDSLTLLGCVDFATTPSAVLWDANAGTTYRIRVTGEDDNLLVRATEAGVRGQFTAVVSDATNNYGAYSAMALTSDGRPVIAYTDDTNNQLRFAERAANGTWTDVLVDDGGTNTVGTDVAVTLLTGSDFAIAYGDATAGTLKVARRTAGTWATETISTNGPSAGTDNSIRRFSDGRIGVAYYDQTAADVRFAVRSVAGVWSDVLVENGTTFSSNVRPGTESLQEYGGNIVISFVDVTNLKVRVSTSTDNGATWSSFGASPIDLAFDAQTGPDALATGVAPNGNLWVIVDQNEGGTIAVEFNGTAWAIDQAFDPGRRAAQSFGGLAGLRFADDGQPVIAYTSNLMGGTGAVLRRTGAGWLANDLWATGFALGSADFAGEAATVATRDGFELLPGGRTIMSTSALSASTTKNALVVAEDTLIADAGTDISGAAGDPLALDASATTDGWGSVSTYEWTVPPSCALTQADNALPSASITCSAGVTNGTVRVAVTDADGWQNTDTLILNVTPPPTSTTSTTSTTTTTTTTTTTPPPPGIGPFTCDLTPSPLTDVPDSSFAREPVDCLYNLQVTTGTSSTTYSPKQEVTREQMAAFMRRLYEAMKGEACSIVATPFADVPATSFARDDIACIFGLDVTTGTSATTYEPSATVTREQMAAFLARLWLAVYNEPCVSVVTPFADVPTSSFAFDAVGCIFGHGITTGTGATTYSPAGVVTREQMAAFLARFYEVDNSG